MAENFLKQFKNLITVGNKKCLFSKKKITRISSQNPFHSNFISLQAIPFFIFSIYLLKQNKTPDMSRTLKFTSQVTKQLFTLICQNTHAHENKKNEKKPKNFFLTGRSVNIQSHDMTVKDTERYWTRTKEKGSKKLLLWCVNIWKVCFHASVVIIAISIMYICIFTVRCQDIMKFFLKEFISSFDRILKIFRLFFEANQGENN